MAFDKETAKEAGKKSKRGSDNQLKELRDVYSELLNNNKDNVQDWFNRIAEENPAKALELFIKMGSFVVPKLRSVEVKSNTPKETPKIIFV